MILLERADVLVVDKPPGVTVIPARGEPPEACLRAQLEAQRAERLFVVHRLDRDTSGVLVFARNEAAHRTLSMAFAGHEVEKGYLAWVAGALEPETGTIDLPLHEARKGKVRPAAPNEAGARAASTDYAVEKRWANATRVALRPHTGRRHQIRVHLRSRNAPILFDPLYGKTTFAAFTGAPTARLALHAKRLSVPGQFEVEAPLPDDLRALETWLDAA